MSSLKKRVTVAMIVGFLLLVVGIAMSRWGFVSFDHALKNNFAHAEQISDEELVISFAPGMTTGIVGVVLAVFGLLAFIFSLVLWKRNPQPGSKLTFSGWKTPEQMTESDVAQDKAWRAIFWGQLATQSWLLQTCIGGYRALLLHTALAMKIMLLLITICTVFYALGIRLCRRRDPASVAAAPRTWKLALALNYGGLVGFLIFIGALFLLRLRA